MIVGSGGVITNSILKMAFNSSTFVLTNGGTFFAGGLQMGNTNNSNIRLLIGSSDGSQTSTFNVGNWTINLGGYFNRSNNSNNLIQISSNGLLTNFSGVTIGGDATANSNNSLNQLIVTNGGVAVNNVGNAINIGRSTNNNSNSLIVTGPGSLFNAGSGAILVGAPTNNGINVGNNLQVLNGGVLSNAGTITVDNSNSYVSVSGGTLYASNVALNSAGTSLTVSNGGTLVLINGITVGSSSATSANQSAVLTLAGGSIAGAGTLTTGANNSAGISNAFVWTGGTLSMGTVVATNSSGAGWSATVPGGSISNNTLYNTNAGVMAPGTVGTAGRFIVTGKLCPVRQRGPGARSAWNPPGDQLPALSQQQPLPRLPLELRNRQPRWRPAGELGRLHPLHHQFLHGGHCGGGLTNNLNGAHISGNQVVATDGFGVLRIVTNATSLTLTNYVFNQYTGSGNWGSGGTNSWTAGLDPNIAGAGALLGTNGSGSVTLDANRTVSALVMSNAAGSVLASSGGAVLSLTNNPGVTTNASLTLASGNGTISAGLNLRTNVSVASTGDSLRF